MYHNSVDLSVGWILITQEDMPPPQAGQFLQQTVFASCCPMSRAVIILKLPARSSFFSSISPDIEHQTIQEATGDVS